MAPNLKMATFRIDRRTLEGLEEVKRRDGVPVSEQVRRALDAWLKEKGVKAKTERPRADTRKRS